MKRFITLSVGRWPQALSGGLALLLLPELALAHMPVKGMNNFYNGFLHPLFIPAQVLVLLALGFLLGQQKPRDVQPAITVFLLALVTGLVGNSFVPPADTGILLLIVAALTGLLVIIARPLPVSACVVMSLLAGVLLGLDSSQQDLSMKQKTVAFMGSGISIYLLLLYATGFAEFFSKKYWQKIAIRILGSWITASALLVLSLGFAPAPGKNEAVKQDQGRLYTGQNSNTLASVQYSPVAPINNDAGTTTR